MERKIIHPWKWQDPLGFVQATEVVGGQRVLYCAGQLSVDADGKSLHAGDFGAPNLNARSKIWSNKS